MKDAIYNIEIMAWDKHQTDRTKNWFKVKNDIFMDHKFHSLSASAKLVVIYLWTVCSREQTKSIQFRCKHASKLIPLRYNFVQSATNELERFQMLKILSVTESVPRKERKQERSIEQTRVYSSTPKKWRLNDTQIDPIYKKYPRKQGKQAGYKKLKSLIKSEDQLLEFEKSVEKFCEIMAKEKRDPEFIPIFSTFVNSQWEDYLEDDVGTVTNEKTEAQKKEDLKIWDDV